METSFRDNSSSLHAENGGLNLTKLELEWRLFGWVNRLQLHEEAQEISYAA